MEAFDGVKDIGKAPDQATLLNELKQTRPLSVLMREQVEALRSWAKGRCAAAD